MVMGLIYMYQLYTLYTVMGLEIQPGSFGVTVVKRLFLPKMLVPPTDYMLWSCDSSILISYKPSTKVMVVEFHPGSFGVTGVKRSFSYFSYRLHGMVMGLMHIHMLDTYQSCGS